MKTQDKIKKLRIIGTVWIISIFILLLVGIFAMWRYDGFSGLLNAWRSFDLYLKLIIPVIVLFCFAILLVPGFSSLLWASDLRSSLERMSDSFDPKLASFSFYMAIFIIWIIVFTLIIVISIFFIYFLMSLASKIGIWNVILRIWNVILSLASKIGIWNILFLFGLINLIGFLIIDSKRRQKKD